MECAVAYYRVSTKQQHRSGLGIEAQRATVTRFAEAEKITIIAEYVEAASGKGAGCPARIANSTTLESCGCPNGKVRRD
jgi:DNA invertase Pin-like site-specific DNA recombinase